MVDLYQFERSARKSGLKTLVGVDEAGRGPLAGPVVAAAVSIPPNRKITGLNDSKKLSAKVRQKIFLELECDKDILIGVAEITAEKIDQINILNATHLAMRSAVLKIGIGFDLIFVDGLPVPNLPFPSKNIIKGDSKCASIAAASIIAKVHRDSLMINFDNEFPGYHFKRHKGYATKEHLDCVNLLGPCPIHRRSFAPIYRLVNRSPKQTTLPFT